MGIARQILLVDKVPADMGNIAMYDMTEDCVIMKSHDGKLGAEKKTFDNSSQTLGIPNIKKVMKDNDEDKFHETEDQLFFNLLRASITKERTVLSVGGMNIQSFFELIKFVEEEDREGTVIVMGEGVLDQITKEIDPHQRYFKTYAKHKVQDSDGTLSYHEVQVSEEGPVEDSPVGDSPVGEFEGYKIYTSKDMEGGLAYIVPTKEFFGVIAESKNFYGMGVMASTKLATIESVRF